MVTGTELSEPSCELPWVIEKVKQPFYLDSHKLPQGHDNRPTRVVSSYGKGDNFVYINTFACLPGMIHGMPVSCSI